MCVGAVDLDLCHKGEGDAVVEAAELGDLLVGAGLLVRELVAGEADDDQSLLLILLIKGLQAIVLRGEAALGCGVDNHKDLAFVLGEVHLCALVVQGFEFIYLCHIIIIYIVYDTNIRLYFYIANDILKIMAIFF